MKIRSLVLETKNVDKLAGFYQKVLELTVVTSQTEFFVSIGSTTIHFKQSVNAEPFYHFAINIPSNKIEVAKEWLSKKLELLWIEDYQSVIADFANWKAKSVYFFDAAGNIVELIARFDLPNETEEQFSSKHFLSVSEIGLVFPQHEIENKTMKLLQQYSLSYFDKQPPSPNFKVVGDDEGLFIIVTAHRNWYPTAKASGIFPVELTFEQKEKTYNAVFG
jgi:hypothetical protein